MKLTLLFLLFIFLINSSFAQKHNVKIGLWSDLTVWDNNTLPSSTDDVILNYDITIDAGASCNSLNTNGHKVTVNSGVNFSVAGVNKLKKLSRLYSVDTSLNVAHDTMVRANFYYDVQNRMTRFEIILYLESGPSDVDIELYDYYYNGEDTLPYQIVHYTPYLETFSPDYKQDTSYIFYNNGRITIDSAIGLQLTRTNHYSYSGDTIFHDQVTYFPFKEPEVDRYDTVTLKYINGNITEQRTWDWYYTQKYTYTYDNHLNPFFKMHLGSMQPYYNKNTDASEIFTRNNMITGDQEIRTRSNNNIDEELHSMFYYQYRPDGYPDVIYCKDGYNSWTKLLLFYED